MQNDCSYVPILKGKEGEFKSLQKLDNLKGKFIPIIEVMPIPFDFAEKKASKSIDDHLKNLDEKIEKGWGVEFPIFIDGLSLMEDTNEYKITLSDGSHPMSYIFQKLSEKNIQSIPVTGLFRSPSYQTAISQIIEKDKRGCLLRLEPIDFEEKILKEQINVLIEKLKLSPAEVDLLIDLKEVQPDQVKLLTLAVEKIMGALPSLDKWRSLILSGTSFPVNLSGIPSNSTKSISRGEWALWKEIFESKISFKRLPIYSDYSIAHCGFQIEGVDPRFMDMSANIRYTVDSDWLVVKGKGVRVRKNKKQREKKNKGKQASNISGLEGFDQYHYLSKQLIAMTEYKGKDFSWGDDYIFGCAHHLQKCGNATTWREVGTSHHITFVIEQLSNLVSSSMSS